VEALKAAVRVRPISVLIDATPLSAYRSGVISSSSGCNPDNLNHAVLLVGYKDNAWIVKNSWGSGWGESGYVRYAMEGNGKGPCGLYQQPIIPNI